MKSPCAQILEACSAVGATSTDVVASVASQLRSEIERRYARRQRGLLWERMRNDVVAIHDREAWRQLAHAIPRASIIVFFDEESDVGMIEVSPGRLISAVIGDTSFFDVYFTDIDGTFLIALNHHDMCCADGEARAWIQTRRD